jgi:hypothetical protein
VSILCLALSAPAWTEGEPCGQVPPGHEGVIPEWPNEPVDFDCGRGFSELSLCILNREGIDWLKNAGPQFVAIYDGQAIYALTREGHPAYPMIVRREVKQRDNGSVDKAASDQLIEDYKKLDADISDRIKEKQTEEKEGP